VEDDWTFDCFVVRVSLRAGLHDGRLSRREASSCRQHLRPQATASGGGSLRVRCELTNSGATYAGSSNYFAANYPQFLAGEGYLAEAAIAAEHTWRVPTLEEHKRAYANGLFVYGNNVWNFDSSPEAGFQPVAYEGGPRWCSDPPTKGKQAKAWFFDIGSGDYGQIGVNSGIRAPVVVYSLAD
jgi:hypothetical protein